jgi:hypothetical protein
MRTPNEVSKHHTRDITPGCSAFLPFNFHIFCSAFLPFNFPSCLFRAAFDLLLNGVNGGIRSKNN